MAVTTADFHKYLRNPPESPEELAIYLNAALSKAKDAGIPSFKRNAQYDIFILSLAAMYYENRGMAFSGSYQATAESNARSMINSFVLQLRGATEDDLELSKDGVGDE